MPNAAGSVLALFFEHLGTLCTVGIWRCMCDVVHVLCTLIEKLSPGCGAGALFELAKKAKATCAVDCAPNVPQQKVLQSSVSPSWFECLSRLRPFAGSCLLDSFSGMKSSTTGCWCPAAGVPGRGVREQQNPQ